MDRGTRPIGRAGLFELLLQMSHREMYDLVDEVTKERRRRTREAEKHQESIDLADALDALHAAGLDVKRLSRRGDRMVRVILPGKRVLHSVRWDRANSRLRKGCGREGLIPEGARFLFAVQGANLCTWCAWKRSSLRGYDQ